MTQTLEDIIDGQLIAYNQGDYESFVSYYDPHIVSYNLETGALIPSLCGPRFFEHYRQKFTNHPALHCQVLSRLIHNDLSVDQEVVTLTGGHKMKTLVIYQIKEGKIHKMWFTPEEAC